MTHKAAVSKSKVKAVATTAKQGDLRLIMTHGMQQQ
jgi:hypothetical protein